VRSAAWRSYRGHLIVEARGLLGLRRFEVWDGRTFLGSFASVVRAELHVDRRLVARKGS